MMQITLFGPFEVQRDGRPVMGLDARKTQELLAFLLIQRSRAYSREFLAEMLWGERAPAQSKKYLRQTLWQVHSALDGLSLAGDDASLLAVEGEWVRYNERCPVALDVAQFEDAYARAVGVAGCALDAPCVDALRQAAQLYRGDLLQGCYDDWCIFERERLQTMYLAMLDKLIDSCQAQGQYERGLGYGATILRYDRAREGTHRRMMQLYCLAGDRSSALRQYEQLVHALREELDVEPSRRSVLLREQIRADAFPVDLPPTGGSPGSPPSGPGPRQADPHTYLRYLHSSLIAMQQQIRQELEVIELALSDA